MRPGELPGNEVRSVVVRSAPSPNTGAHLLERIPLWTMSTRIYVAPLAHVTVRPPLDCALLGHRTPVILLCESRRRAVSGSSRCLRGARQENMPPPVAACKIEKRRMFTNILNYLLFVKIFSLSILTVASSNTEGN